MAGLLDAFGGGGGLPLGPDGTIDPQAYQQARANQGLLGFAAGILSQGPSRLPVPFSQGVGLGLQGMLAGQKGADDTALNAAKLGQLSLQGKQLQAQLAMRQDFMNNNKKIMGLLSGDDADATPAGGTASPAADASSAPTDPAAMQAASTPAAPGRLSIADMKAAALRAGFQGPAADIIAATAMAESGGDPNAANEKGEHSYGITQINADAHGPIAKSALGNPDAAMQLAYKISNGGTNFAPWTMFKNGQYKQYLPLAQAASAKPVQVAQNGPITSLPAAAGITRDASGDLLRNGQPPDNTINGQPAWLTGTSAPGPISQAASVIAQNSQPRGLLDASSVGGQQASIPDRAPFGRGKIGQDAWNDAQDAAAHAATEAAFARLQGGQPQAAAQPIPTAPQAPQGLLAQGQPQPPQGGLLGQGAPAAPQGMLAQGAPPAMPQGPQGAPVPMAGNGLPANLPRGPMAMPQPQAGGLSAQRLQKILPALGMADASAAAAGIGNPYQNLIGVLQGLPGYKGAQAGAEAGGKFPYDSALKSQEAAAQLKNELAKLGLQMSPDGSVAAIPGFNPATQDTAEAKSRGTAAGQVHVTRDGMVFQGTQLVGAAPKMVESYNPDGTMSPQWVTPPTPGMSSGLTSLTGGSQGAPAAAPNMPITKLSPATQSEGTEHGKQLADIGNTYFNEAKAAKDQNYMLDQMLATSRGFKPGAGADEAATVKSIVNSIFPDAFKESLPSYQEFQKYAIQNAREQTRSMGAGEAASVFTTNIQANPNAKITREALESVIGGMHALNDYKVARDNAAADWRNNHAGSMEGFSNSDWTKSNPILLYKMPYMTTDELARMPTEQIQQLRAAVGKK